MDLRMKQLDALDTALSEFSRRAEAAAPHQCGTQFLARHGPSTTRDLARATAQEVQAHFAGWCRSGLFGRPLGVPPHAFTQDHVLGLAGRSGLQTRLDAH